MTKTMQLVAMFALTPLILTACTAATPKVETDHLDKTEVQEGQQTAVKYIPYNEKAYNDVLGSESFVLFFHAEWCPTCRGMEEAILNEMETFPGGTKILKADYDTETELKKTYGITTQSIIVIVDKDGNATETLAAPSNADIIAALKKVM